MEIDAKIVMKLRADTGAGMMDCKKALQECGGDYEKAKDWLRARGQKVSDKKSGRATKAGHVGAYLHHTGGLGVLVEVLCETDFVARNDKFKEFVRKLAMHIAAASPAAVKAEHLDPALVERERAVYTEQANASGKSPEIAAKMVEGRLRKEFYQQVVLLQQTFLGAGGDGKATVEQVLKAAEKTAAAPISIASFVRYALGEGDKGGPDAAPVKG